MLSRDLRHLKSWFDAVLIGLQEFTLDGAKAFSDGLGAAVADAEALEDATVPPSQRLDRLRALQIATGADPKVVLFPVAPRRVPLEDGGAA